jgi:uncharacterized protein YjbI with pentapeptide repeats
MSEQQSQATVTTGQSVTSACPHPEAVGMRWGDPISEERQAALETRLQQWKAQTGQVANGGPFAQVRLTGADVFWLVTRAHREIDGTSLPGGEPVTNTSFTPAQSTLQTVFEFDFEALPIDENIRRAKHGSDLLRRSVHLEDADLTGAHLEGADLMGAHLEEAILHGAYLQEADLTAAHLEGAKLMGAHLQRTYLNASHLEGAHLDGAEAHGADLWGAYFNTASTLYAPDLFNARLSDVNWGGVNLSFIDWSRLVILGNEVVARQQSTNASKRKDPHTRLDEYKDAVRANRQVATALHAQGLKEDADRFAYRAQVLQRQVLRRHHRYAAAIGSWFLDLISGYGYKPVRSFNTYVLVVLGFAAAYFALGSVTGQALPWNEAIVVSMTAFHGRGFFAAVFQPGDLQAAVAAVEAFIGLLIEIVFIATFTQRFFAR